jgi:4-hydroxybenzoyl-CoA thioesterase/acyl-CoA thioester hydrolase
MRDEEPTPRGEGEFHYRRLVQFAETDLAGIVHFSWYFRYMEEAEHALWRAAGLSITGDGLHWPRVAASCDYRQPLRFEEEIDVLVRPAFGRRRLEYAFTITRGGSVVSTGAMTSVCARIDVAGEMRSIDVPDAIVEKLRGALTYPK